MQSLVYIFQSYKFTTRNRRSLWVLSRQRTSSDSLSPCHRHPVCLRVDSFIFLLCKCHLSFSVWYVNKETDPSIHPDVTLEYSQEIETKYVCNNILHRILGTSTSLLGKNFLSKWPLHHPHFDPYTRPFPVSTQLKTETENDRKPNLSISSINWS